jgi:hypothetical protein
MSLYVDPDMLKKSLTLTGTTFADDDIAAAALAASDAVDEMCGRIFSRDDTSDSTRYYRPQSATLILIDDLHSFTSLLSDNDGDYDYERSWVNNLEFILEPNNAIADGWPWTRIVLNTYRTSAGFPYWIPKSVKLTGKFGWPAVPDAVVRASQLLANRLLQAVRTPFGIITTGSNTLDSMSAVRIARTDPFIGPLLAPYTREKVATVGP